MKFLPRAVLVGWVAALACLLVRAADEKPKDSLPSPRDVLDRYAKEIGGKSAFGKHDSQRVIGTIELPAQKISGKMEVFAARPNKLLMKVSMPAIGDVTTGFNGEVG